MPCKLSLGISGYLGLSVVCGVHFNSSPSPRQTEYTKGSENYVTPGIPKESLGFRTMGMNTRANLKYSRGAMYKTG